MGEMNGKNTSGTNAIVAVECDLTSLICHHGNIKVIHPKITVALKNISNLLV